MLPSVFKTCVPREEILAGEFRPSDEYETAIASTTTFKIVADYGNGEVIEKETQAKPLTYGTGTPPTLGGAEGRTPRVHTLLLFTQTCLTKCRRCD